jgi:hypothetical protein
MASAILPIPSLLPDGPDEEPFTAAQWTMLMAIMDTVIQSIGHEPAETKSTSNTVSEEAYDAAINDIKNTIAEAPGAKALDEYMDEKASDITAFRDMLKRAFGQALPPDARKKLGFILGVLECVKGLLVYRGILAYAFSF